MIAKKAHSMRLLALIWISVFVCLSEGLASAEDWLSKKDGALYLGWAQPEGIFLTCAKNPIPIGKGKIEQAQEQCPPKSGSSFPAWPRPSPFRIIGEVEGKDIVTNTLKLKETSGGTKSFYYLPTDLGSGTISFNDIKIGDKITITGPMQGRADAITR